MTNDDNFLLSRVAENIYWMTRYLERAENIARLIDVNNTLILDLPTGLQCQWTPLIQTTASTEAYAKKYDAPDARSVIHFLTFDEENPNSLLSCVRSSRENARRVRERISSEMWEVLNKLYLDLRESRTRADALIDEPASFFNGIRMQCQAFYGVMASTLSRGTAWNFACLGQMLERAEKTSRMLDVKYFYLLPNWENGGGAVDTIQWSALLNSASALEMYRYRHNMISPDLVAHFLLLDLNFPRSVLHCLLRAEAELKAISGDDGSSGSQPEGERQIGRLNATLRFSTIEEIFHSGMHEFLDDVQTRINAIDDCVFTQYFAGDPQDAH